MQKDIKLPMLRSGQFKGQKSRGPIKMSLEMAQKVIVPQKKLNSGTLIVIILLVAPREIYLTFSELLYTDLDPFHLADIFSMALRCKKLQTFSLETFTLGLTFARL